MRKELIEYAKTVSLDTTLDEIREHVRDMDEFRYVFSMAQKNWLKNTEVFPFNKNTEVFPFNKNTEVFPFNNDKEVVVSEEIMDKARERFKDANLDTLKTSTVQKELNCGYSVAWRVKYLLKKEQNI